MKKSSRFGLMQTLMPPLMGVLLLLNNLGKPRVEALHGPDVPGPRSFRLFVGDRLRQPDGLAEAWDFRQLHERPKLTIR